MNKKIFSRVFFLSLFLVMQIFAMETKKSPISWDNFLKQIKFQAILQRTFDSLEKEFGVLAMEDKNLQATIIKVLRSSFFSDTSKYLTKNNKYIKVTPGFEPRFQIDNATNMQIFEFNNINLQLYKFLAESKKLKNMPDIEKSLTTLITSIKKSVNGLKEDAKPVKPVLTRKKAKRDILIEKEQQVFHDIKKREPIGRAVKISDEQMFKIYQILIGFGNTVTSDLAKLLDMVKKGEIVIQKEEILEEEQEPKNLLERAESFIIIKK